MYLSHRDTIYLATRKKEDHDKDKQQHRKKQTNIKF